MILVKGKGRYDLDKIVDNYNNNKLYIYAITKKNVQFIETVVALDSHYFNADLDKYYDDMQQDTNFDDSLFNVIKIINSTNHTRLSKNEMNGYRNELLNIFNDYKSMKSKLDSDYDAIVDQLCRYPGPKPKDKTKYNISFASKICFNLHERFVGNSYPKAKYDKVVASNLPKYVNYYLKECVPNKRFLIDGKGIDDKIRIFNDYQEYITKIIQKIRINVNRKEFDHLIWWLNK